MNKKFNAIFELTLQFSTLGYCASASDAGHEAIKRAKLEDGNDGRKWAIVTPQARTIIVGGRQGWLGFSEYGDVFICKSYTDTSFYQGNPYRVKNVITMGILEGHPMVGITNVLDLAVSGEALHEVDRYFTKMEEVIQQFDQ